jgi:hypothetical protein
MFTAHHSLRAAALSAALFLSVPAAEAGILQYAFTGTLDFGSLLGESYSGQASFDDSALTGTGNESLPLTGLSFSFHGSSFGLGSGAAAPTADFLDGVFLGLSYEVTAIDPDFSLISGGSDITEAYLAYTPDNSGNAAGFGSLIYSQVVQVPEPATLALMGGGWLAFRRRRLAPPA